MKRKHETLTEQEAIAEIERLRALLDVAQPVVEAAIANANAITAWRGAAHAAPAPSGREQRRIMDSVDETRTGLLEAVDAYKTAQVMARLQPALNQIPAAVERAEARRA